MNSRHVTLTAFLPGQWCSSSVPGHIWQSVMHGWVPLQVTFPSQNSWRLSLAALLFTSKIYERRFSKQGVVSCQSWQKAWNRLLYMRANQVSINWAEHSHFWMFWGQTFEQKCFVANRRTSFNFWTDGTNAGLHTLPPRLHTHYLLCYLLQLIELS